VDVLGYFTAVNLTRELRLWRSVAAKIQESDDATTWTDFTGGGLPPSRGQTTTPSGDRISGGKQYVRVVATVAGAACEFSADLITMAGGTRKTR
jgi:hypothetical protein